MTNLRSLGITVNGEDVYDLVEQHANRLEEDIRLARTRDEHLRVTARANEARQIANMLTGLRNAS